MYRWGADSNVCLGGGLSGARKPKFLSQYLRRNNFRGFYLILAFAIFLSLPPASVGFGMPSIYVLSGAQDTMFAR